MKRSAISIIVALLIGALLQPAVTKANVGPEPLDLVRLDTAVLDHAVLPSLGDLRLELPELAPVRRSITEAPSTYIKLNEAGGRDPLLASGSPAQRAPEGSISFEGIATTRFLPPDPVGDVGPTQYVEAVNGAFAVFSKSGDVLAGPSAMSALWGPLGSPCTDLGQGDPIVQYDSLAGRWLISEFAFAESGGQPAGPFFQCIAISRSSDALGGFDLYSFRISDTLFPDFPKFGVWPDAYYMTVHFFTQGTGQYAGQGVFAFDRAKMLAGSATPGPIGFTNPQLLGVLPSDVDGTNPPPAGSPNYLVAVEDDGVGFPSDRLEIFKFKVDFANPGNSTLTSGGTMPTASFDQNMCSSNFDCLPQPGTTQRLDAIGDGVIMYRLAYRNFGDHESIVLNHVVDVNGSDRAGIRWYEIRSPGSSPRIFQQGTFSPDSHNRWMSSMAMDASGNIAMGYSVASSSLFPSIRFTGRGPGDALGSLAPEQSIIEGGGSQTGNNRWGDYSSMTVDPADDCTFWYVQEYYPSTSTDGWRTRIASLRFPGCAAGPAPTTSPSPNPTSSPNPTPTPTPTPTPEPDGGLIAGLSDRPDPFTPNGDGRKERVKIFFTLTGDSDMRVTAMILNRRGGVVRLLAEQVLSPGPWVTKWGGRTDSGSRSRSGTYTYRIEAVDGSGNQDVATGTVALRR